MHRPDRSNLWRICRELDELAVELTGISARTRISVQAVRLVERQPNHDVYEWGIAQGFLGIERHSPHMPIVFHRTFASMDPGGGIFTLDGELATEASTLLPEFCTLPLPRTRVETPSRYLLHFVEPDEKAVDPLDVVVGQRFRSSRPAERRDLPLRLSLGVRIPSQQLLCSIYTHESIPVGPSPTLRMFHPGTREMPGPVDARWFDQVADLGGPRRIASPEQLCDSRAERILQGMGRMLFEKLGWDMATYVHHVVDVAMPIWGVEYTVDFA